MKQKILAINLVLLSILFLSVPCFSSPNINGIFNDGDGDIGYGIHDNYNAVDTDEWTTSSGVKNYVNGDGIIVHEPQSQSFDAEFLGLFIDDNKLYVGLQAGFNLADGVNYNYRNYMPGDIALDFGGDNTFEAGFRFTFNPDNTLSSANLYFVDNSSVYSSASDWALPGWSDAGPYKIKNADPNNPDSFIAASDSAYKETTAYYNGYSFREYTLEAAVNLTDLTAKLGTIFTENDKVTVHWTMSCGNDYLDHTTTYTASAVPEPSSMLLFGFGLLGISAALRKKQENQA